MEREIFAPIDLWRPEGVLDPRAIGWSRGALHRCRLAGPWGRRKRWHYWCVTSPSEIISLTLADLDYLGLAVIVIHDLATGQLWRDARIRPLGWGIAYPESANRGRVTATSGRFHVAFDDGGTLISLTACGHGAKLEITVERPAGHESLGVAVAPTPTTARYSNKQNTLPARGWFQLGGARRAIAPGAFACLDWGRGVWPAHTQWNWASASGVCDGRTIGLNLGARWTDGGGATENALCIDGRLHKLAGDVGFQWCPSDPRRPWRLTGYDVDLRFTPTLVDGIAGPRGGPLPLRLCFGRFTGRVRDIAIHELFGWAEEMNIIW